MTCNNLCQPLIEHEKKQALYIHNLFQTARGPYAEQRILIRSTLSVARVARNRSALIYILNYTLDNPAPDNYIVVMDEIHFRWDPSKNTANQKKHSVSFEEAQTVFFDESAMEFFDSEHSGKEDRFLLLGQSFNLRTLMVCHCHRDEESIIRIISARKATTKERNTYRRNK